MRLKALALGSSNTQALSARFANAYKVGQQAVREVVRDTAFSTYDQVYRDCPVDTGFMREHLTIVFTSDGLAYQIGWDEKEFQAAGLPFYPIFVIFGTRFMEARDVLFPNHERTKRDFKPALQATLSAALQGASRRRRR